MASQGRSPASVLLPTVEWGEVCEQMAAQIGPQDELLVVCDSEADPVAGRNAPDNVRILVAGEPEACSGKANALARGMETARNERFVWTDDDFDHGPDWLHDLVTRGEEAGPATVIPLFIGGGWWRLYEPWVTLTSTFSFYTGFGPWGGNAWGGGVTFTSDDVDVERLVTELRQSLSDDGVLSKHLDDVYPVRSMTAVVELPGDFRSVKERLIRYIRLTHVHEGAVPTLVVLLLLSVIGVAFPLVTASVLTAVMAGVYMTVGLSRWTFLLTFPGLFVAPVTTAAAIYIDEFEWAGRRYRLNGALDVEVIDKGGRGAGHDRAR